MRSFALKKKQITCCFLLAVMAAPACIAIEYNVDLREELESAQRSNAFIDQFTLDNSDTSKSIAAELDGHFINKCSVIEVNWPAINYRNPNSYLRLPVEQGRYVYARLTKSEKNKYGGSWEGQVLSQDGGRVAIFYNEKDQSVTGIVETFTEYRWSFRRHRDKNIICQDSGAPLNDTVIEVAPPDHDTQSNNDAESFNDPAFF